MDDARPFDNERYFIDYCVHLIKYAFIRLFIL